MQAIAFDDSRLLDTWDRAAALERPWRELAVLAGASGQSIDDLAKLSVGTRDRLLLAVRIGTFGSRLDCETSCPHAVRGSSCRSTREISSCRSARSTCRSSS
jgi:hypothetical protein